LTVIITSEFDNFRAPMEEFSKRLKINGRLLESITYPGAMHGFMINTKSQVT
jgi:acetyl esterase/lipase